MNVERESLTYSHSMDLMLMGLLVLIGLSGTTL
jgi:hypothetical protein